MINLRRNETVYELNHGKYYSTQRESSHNSIIIANKRNIHLAFTRCHKLLPFNPNLRKVSSVNEKNLCNSTKVSYDPMLKSGITCVSSNNNDQKKPNKLNEFNSLKKSIINDNNFTANKGRKRSLLNEQWTPSTKQKSKNSQKGLLQYEDAYRIQIDSNIPIDDLQNYSKQLFANITQPSQQFKKSDEIQLLYKQIRNDLEQEKQYKDFKKNIQEQEMQIIIKKQQKISNNINKIDQKSEKNNQYKKYQFEQKTQTRNTTPIPNFRPQDWNNNRFNASEKNNINTVQFNNAFNKDHKLKFNENKRQIEDKNKTNPFNLIVKQNPVKINLKKKNINEKTIQQILHQKDLQIFKLKNELLSKKIYTQQLEIKLKSVETTNELLSFRNQNKKNTTQPNSQIDDHDPTIQSSQSIQLHSLDSSKITSYTQQEQTQKRFIPIDPHEQIPNNKQRNSLKNCVKDELVCFTFLLIMLCKLRS